MKEHWQLLADGPIDMASTASHFWEQILSYFKWCDEHPVEYYETARTGKTQGTLMKGQKRRPYTLEGLCLHCGVSSRWFKDISNMYGGDSPWYRVAEKALSIIYTQNIEGALVDLFNPIVVSKILNLDKPNEQSDKPVKIEIVDTRKGELASSESQVLENLDFDMVQRFNEKLEKGDSTQGDSTKGDSTFINGNTFDSEPIGGIRT